MKWQPSAIGSRTRLSAACMAVSLLIVSPMPADDAQTTARLIATARLWAAVENHHPFLAEGKGIDWDAALVAAIPKIRAAREANEYRAALRAMLDALGDPSTRIAAARQRPVADAPGSPATERISEDGVIIAEIHDPYSLFDPESRKAQEQILADIPKARALLLDIRSPQPVDAFGRQQLTAFLEPIEAHITSTIVSLPGERRRFARGFENVGVFSSGQYITGFLTRMRPAIRPSPAGRELPLVTLLNADAPLPDMAIPLQAAGRGLIVFEGDPSAARSAPEVEVDLGEGLTAHVRTAEEIFPDGTSADLLPDRVVANESGREAFELAMMMARSFQPSKVIRRPIPATATFTPARPYRSSAFPSLELRLLALFRFWSVIDELYPYKDLLPQAWDSVLAEFLPRFQDAVDAVSYAKTIGQLSTRLHDAHAYVAGGAFDQVIGEGYAPIRVRLIEGQPVITAVSEGEAAEAGVAVGDIVVSVDGEPAQSHIERCAEVISASTPQGLRDKAAISFMNGAPGSPLRLVLRNAAGNEREVRLTRVHQDYTTLYHHERTGDVVRLLPGNIGYVDLDRLTIPMVDPMFEQLGHAKAIIFDMRGYPNGTIWAIARRLTSTRPRVALFGTPLSGADEPGPAAEEFFQTIDPTPPGAPLYTGKTIMLMDERSVSQAEHTGLYLKAANATTFVGSPSAGADGEITTVTLPGGVTVGFTGQSVRYPDGRQLQRIGLVPDVTVLPTIRGIRSGVDEVLEKAIEFLNAESTRP